jgi:phosphatidylinositol alpha-1,6-mannosyltransferase
VTGWRDADAASGLPVERIARVRPALGNESRAADLEIRARLLVRATALCRREAIAAVCIADDETAGWLAAPLRRLTGARIILYSHGDDLAERPGEEAIRARRRRQFARADGIVAVSEAAALGLGRVFGVPRARIDVIPNGYDPALFRPAPPDPTLRDALSLGGGPVVVAVGRLVPRKGFDRLIDAMALLNDLSQTRLVIVGEGPERAALEARARAKGAAATFAGAVPHADVPRFLSLADVFAMPNRRMPDGEDEGFGLVFLEAAACGKPVVAGRAGGAPEVVRDGENGLLADGDDAQDVARALRSILTDRVLAARLAARGLEMARGATWQARAGAFLALCDRLGAHARLT